MNSKEKYPREEVDSSWTPILLPLIEHPRFQFIKDELSKGNYCPNQSLIFKCFKECSFSNLQVVFLGQDPYPQKDIATGLAFANKKETLFKDISPSLKIITEELEETYNIDFPYIDVLCDISLVSWTKQGVLLLNSALTVATGKPKSHQDIWHYFIVGILNEISKRRTGIIYVLLGKQAQTFKRNIYEPNNWILEYPHPAADTYNNERRFRGCRVFKEIDTITMALNNTKIKWYETN